MSYKTVRLGDVCQITDGTHYTPKDIKNGFPFLTVKDMSGNGLDFVNCSFISQNDYEIALKGNSSPQIGDVLFSKDGTVGKVHVVKEAKQFAVLSSIAILKTNNDLISSDYLGHTLKLPIILAQAIKSKTGSAIRRIILSDLKKVTIPLPPLPEQQRIAEVLDKADALREKRHLALQKLDTLLQSVFLEMFGDPVKNPKGLETIYLENGITLKGGFAFKSSDYVSDGIPLIRIGEANRGKVDSNNAKFLPPKFLQSHSKFVLQPGDLLMSLTGTTGKDDYANVALLGNEYEYYFLNQRVAQFLMKDGIFTKEYIYQLLKDSQIKAQITGKSRGIRQANISNNDILKLRVAKPPIKLQEKFTAIFHQVKALIKKYKLEESYLENLFQSLQQRAFKGELFSAESPTVKPQEEKVWRLTSPS